MELQIAKVRESTGLRAPKGIQVPHCGADRCLSVKVVISVTITTGEPCALFRQSLLNSLSGDYLDKYHPRLPLGWYTFMAMTGNGSSRFHWGAKIIACNAHGVCTDTVLASTKEQASSWDMNGACCTVAVTPARPPLDSSSFVRRQQ